MSTTQSPAAQYLRKLEWSIGNGQCPECLGVPEDWLGNPNHLKASSIGHKPECKLAAALVAVDEVPLMRGQFRSSVEYEHCITDSGGFSTRLKTLMGCPRFNAWWNGSHTDEP